MARGKRKASKTPTPTTEDAPDDQSLQERAEASKAAEERTRKAAAARMKCNGGKTPRTRATLEKKAVQDDEESETNEENEENEENEGKEGDDEVVAIDKDGEGEDDGEGDDVTDSDDEREAREHIDQFFGLKLPDRSRNRELWQKALVQVFKRLGRAGRRLEEVELRVDNLEDKAGRGAGRRTTRGWMISSGLDMNAADKAPVL